MVSLRRIMLLSLILLLGCGVINPTAHIPSRKIPLPETDYLDVVWLPDGRLILNTEDGPDSYQTHVLQSQVDGKQISEMPQPRDPSCSRADYLLYGLLPDGRVQIGKHCYPFLPPRGRGVLDEKMYLLAFEPTSGTLTPLMSKSVLPPTLLLPIAQITWNPTVERGILGTGGGLYETLAWLTPRGYEDATITIKDGAREWRLDELLHGDLGHPSPRLGNASWPAWSPDGKSIAFLASPQVVGVDGLARLDAPWNLYMMDPVEQKPLTILNDIKHPRSLAWSPDGKWLAFAGERTLVQKGLWLFDPATKTLKQVTDKYTTALAWSPDGQQIVGIYKPDESQRHTEVWIFDVSRLIKTQ